jgi:hypothetical protein
MGCAVREDQAATFRPVVLELGAGSCSCQLNSASRRWFPTRLHFRLHFPAGQSAARPDFFVALPVDVSPFHYRYIKFMICHRPAAYIGYDKIKNPAGGAAPVR